MILIVLFGIIAICCLLIYAINSVTKSRNEFYQTPEGQKELEYQRRFNQTLRDAEQRAAERPPVCPKCHSAQVTGGITRSTFSVGKAAVGGVLLGGVGTLAGFAGNKKATLACMKCGHTWNP